MKFCLSPFVLCALVFLAAVPSRAEIKIASPFTDHMVLQRELPVPVWGIADASQQVRIEFADQSKSVKADASGHWRVVLDPMQASKTGRVLRAWGDTEKAPSIELKDVLVGEVWLASGQSNMDFTVGRTAKRYFAGVRDENTEVAAANYPLIRMFTGEWTMSNTPRDTLAGAWKICTPENVVDFSAVAYFFARKLQQELDVPVGIMTLAYGASTAQAWIQREAIASDERLKPVLDEFDARAKAYVPPTVEQQKAWQAEVEAAKAAGKHPPRTRESDPVQDQHNPTVLYNGMIAPVEPYALRGVIWYQGESITEPRTLFPHWNEVLIKNWRQRWGSDLPFYFCQLAAHDAKGNISVVRAWQAEALKLPNTGMAVTIDIGDTANVHPKNKQDVGDRLGRVALAKTYGKDIEYSGPVFEKVRVEGRTLKLSFSHASGELLAKDGPLRAFEIAGPDRKYFPAQASIERDGVVVQNQEVADPKSVRYAWSNDPVGCNLYNQAGLPAAPFQTERAEAK